MIYARLADLPERSPTIPVDPPEDLGRVLARAQALLAGRPQTARIRRQLEQVRIEPARGGLGVVPA